MTTMTTMIKLNDYPLLYLQQFDNKFPEMGANWYIKNWHWQDVTRTYRLNPYVWDVLHTMYANCPRKYKYLFIDIKVQDLLVGRNTANGHWHLDSSLIPDVEYHNQIFVTGVNRTEFITTPLEIPVVNTSKEFNNYINQYQGLDVVRVPESTIVVYNGRNVHRGVPVIRNERRLLIRMVNTDKQLPQGIGEYK